MRLSVLTVAALLAANIAAAQPPAQGRPDAAQRLERLATLLDLTDTQKLQVQQVLDEEHAKMQALHAQMRASGQKPSFDQMRATFEQMHQETLAAVKPLLSADQYKKFELLSQGHGRHGFRHAPQAAPPASSN
jgi:hypothetical protein